MDKFSDTPVSLTSPIEDAFAVTPSDTQDLPFVTRCLNVSQTGPVRMLTKSGSEVTLTVTAGIPFPVRARRIFATGTSAGAIVGLQ